MEPVTASSELLLWEAIDEVRGAEDGPELSLDELAECVMAALGPSLSLQQICRAADGLLHLADDPSQGSAARQVPVADVQPVQERALNLLDWQELEEEDDRSDSQKLIALHRKNSGPRRLLPQLNCCRFGPCSRPLFREAQGWCGRP